VESEKHLRNLCVEIDKAMEELCSHITEITTGQEESVFKLQKIRTKPEGNINQNRKSPYECINQLIH